MIDRSELKEGYYWASRYGRSKVKPVEVVWDDSLASGSNRNDGYGVVEIGEESVPWPTYMYNFFARLEPLPVVLDGAVWVRDARASTRELGVDG